MASHTPRWLIREARAEDDVAIGELLVRAFVDSYARKMPDVVVTATRMTDRNIEPPILRHWAVLRVAPA